MSSGVASQKSVNKLSFTWVVLLKSSDTGEAVSRPLKHHEQTEHCN